MPKEESLPSRKKMRKGTHSCFECRRRKIRCIFPTDNPNVCSECFARGSRCIDQEHADPEVVVDHRKNLRERVSRLEALVDSLLDDKTEKSSDSASTSFKTPVIMSKDTLPPTPLSCEPSSAVLQSAQRAPSDRGHHVPILSVFEAAFNDAEDRIKEQFASHLKGSTPKPMPNEDERYTISYDTTNAIMEEISPAQSAQAARARQALFNLLPPQPKLNKLLNSNSEWWLTWRRKCSGTCASIDETLAQFATKALAGSNIGAIALVVLAVAISSDDEKEVERHIDAIDQLVLANDEYAATLEGMELFILKAKWYADVGQPRRAWLAHRKGLMYTQLMGLHRKRTNSTAHESIWWSLYHGDRFLSLFLGLPYGINDIHCDLSLPQIPDSGPYLAPLIFMNRVAGLGGKVIDRNQGIAEQSFAWALQLDQELEDLYKQLDPNWLEYSELLADAEGNAADLREKIMVQMIYHQIRVYLHLPFMLKSQQNPRFTYSRTACLFGSREVLRLYQSLRTGTVQPLYECKAIDFIGFTSAVLVMLGIFDFGAPPNFSATSSALKEKEADIRLIEICIDIFHRASSEKGGKVAMQSSHVLEKMLQRYRMETDADYDGDSCCNGANGQEMMEFVIPYFGTISVKRGGKKITPIDIPPHVARGAKRAAGARPASTSSTPNQQATPKSDSLSTKSGNDLFSRPNKTNTSLTPQTSTPNASPSQPHSSNNNNNHNFNLSTSTQGPFVSYEGFYNWGSSLDHPHPSTHGGGAGTGAAGTGGKTTSTGSTTGTQINDDSLSNYPLPTNNFSWQNMPMDIDQDWSWFLNDGGDGGVGGGALGVDGGAAAAAGQQTVGSSLFQQQGFYGFG